MIERPEIGFFKRADKKYISYTCQLCEYPTKRKATEPRPKKCPMCDSEFLYATSNAQ